MQDHTKSCLRTSGLAGGRLKRAAQRRVARRRHPVHAGRAGDAQFVRRSSARANNSASLGSFPAVSSTSRFNRQPTEARWAGKSSPWQDQPEICRLGSLRCLRKPRQDPVSPGERSSVTLPNLLSTTPAASRFARAFGLHSGSEIIDGLPGLAEFAARAIDLEFRDRPVAWRGVAGRPANDVPAAAQRMPEYLVGLCFFRKIELADRECGVGAVSHAPGRLWPRARSLRPPAIGPIDEPRGSQPAQEYPHRPTDAPACRSIRRRSW